MSSGNKTKYEHLSSPKGSTLSGDWWTKNRLEVSKKSRSEYDDPEGVQEVCIDVAEILDVWIPDEECESQDDFVFDLAHYLDQNCNCDVEVQPDTPHGKPNILLGDKLALVLRINPDKGERGRVIDQCVDYASQWVTWIIIIGGRPNLVGQVNNLMIDKGLDRILIWNFSYD